MYWPSANQGVELHGKQLVSHLSRKGNTRITQREAHTVDILESKTHMYPEIPLGACAKLKKHVRNTLWSLYETSEASRHWRNIKKWRKRGKREYLGWICTIFPSVLLTDILFSVHRRQSFEYINCKNIYSYKNTESKFSDKTQSSMSEHIKIILTYRKDNQLKTWHTETTEKPIWQKGRTDVVAVKYR